MASEEHSLSNQIISDVMITDLSFEFLFVWVVNFDIS